MPQGDVEWSCSCVFCRFFVHPIVRRFGKRVETGEEEVLEQDVISTPISTSVQQPVVDVEKIKESVAEHVSAIVDSKLREFSSRVELVEDEVKRVREDVSKSIDEVKNALVDIRAAIAEVTNPFNILRSYSRTSTASSSKANNIIDSFKKALEEMAGKSSRSSNEGSSQSIGGGDLEAISRELLAKTSSRLSLSGLIKLIRWVDDMLSRVPREVIEEIAKFMRAIDVVDEDEEKIVSGVIDFVYRARKMGLKINEQIIHIYNLAKVFGVVDKEASEEILKLAMDNNSIE
jgi:prophage DNA circulation protein